MHEIEWTDYSRDDYDNLDGHQKVFVDKAIDRIRLKGMQAGDKLHGNLAGCNKMKNKKMGLRIIFKEVDGQVQVIQIIIIGKREEKKVYKDAAKRLK